MRFRHVMGHLRSFVVGTAGHVDHGKTALVRALTGVATDRLPEEKRRGITIELGFAPLALRGGARASVVDVPGHRRFVPTMIAGATGVDLVVLVVAADEGPMPQTREHLAVCELLGLDRGVVALTKIDRVDDEARALAIEEVRRTIDGRLHAEIVPCAPPSGEGVDAVRAAIEAALEGRADIGGPPRMWVDRVLRVRGVGAVLTGTLVRGRIARGDHLALASSRGVRPFVVRGLHVHSAAVDEARAATRLAIHAALDAEEAARGDLVTSEEDAPPPTTCLDASMRGGGARRGASVTVHVGTAGAPARITRVDPLEGDVSLVRLALDTPLPIAAGERHLVRGSHVAGAFGALLGGGVVLDAHPPSRARGSARRALASAVHAGDASRALDALLDREDPRPVDPASASLAVPLLEAAARAVASGALVRCGRGVVRRRTLAALADRARELVTAHVARAPLDRGMPLAALRAELARDAGDDAADAAILAARARRGAEDGGAIAVVGDVALPAARAGRLPREIADRVDRARAFIVESGAHGASIGRLAEILDVPPDRARAVVAALEREGGVVRAGELWFARAVVDDVRARIVARLAAGPPVTVIEAKSLCALPRRQAILLLEHLDAAGVTRRVGDARVLVGAAP